MRVVAKFGIVAVLVLLLVLVRLFEEVLFYDPFMYFFQGCISENPELFRGHWYANVALRFVANTLISLAVIYVVFEKKSSVKFAALLYTLLFIVLFPLFIFLMERVEENDYLAVFYVRRFLVQPILLLLLLPAFYYQRLKDRRGSK
ncbi:exosortase F system-associated membrane protein [Salinimicrobium sp. GXAS 041]|uniref:exosortase F system-associated membrane protein n=1 Tax=Salinimicrobium sp. GXAS 041 TaxID=3400806 RepID=UPI003C730DE2